MEPNPNSPISSTERYIKDPATTNYEEKTRKLEERISVLDKEIAELELLEGKIKKRNAKKERQKMSRRSILKTGLFTAVAMLIGKSTGTEDSEKEKKNKLRVPSAQPAQEKLTKIIEETAEEEIKKCSQIIKNEQYEEIIKNPCLTSSLYYALTP